MCSQILTSGWQSTYILDVWQYILFNFKRDLYRLYYLVVLQVCKYGFSDAYSAKLYEKLRTIHS